MGAHPHKHLCSRVQKDPSIQTRLFPACNKTNWNISENIRTVSSEPLDHIKINDQVRILQNFSVTQKKIIRIQPGYHGDVFSHLCGDHKLV